MSEWVGWAADVLKAGGWPVTTANEAFLNTWNSYEQSACRNNPLNTTQRLAGSTTCNMVGVQSYATQAQGTKATVQTLTNGFYPALVAALKSGDPFSYVNPAGVAANIKTWGTPNFAAWYIVRAGSFAGTGVAVVPTPTAAGTLATATVPGGFARFSHALARDLPTGMKRAAIVRRAAVAKIMRRSRINAHGR